ncbi:hypothetical protein ACF0H5_001780 [Mactra antiquata]
MPSLFGSGKSGRAVYHKIEQNSDNEFSLSDDEKVLFKKQGEIELNLYPETRIQRPKITSASCKQYLGIIFAIFVVVLSLTIVLVVYKKSHDSKPTVISATPCMNMSTCMSNEQVSVTSTKIPALPGMSIDTSREGWRKTFKDEASEGIVRLLDMDGDKNDDIIINSYIEETSLVQSDSYLSNYSGLQVFCETQGFGSYPCLSHLTGLRGVDGDVLWRLPVRSGVFALQCEGWDINQDNKTDCIATGRMGTIVAFDPSTGEELWRCEDDRYLKSNWNTYTAAVLPDWDDDGVPEVLIANGGDTSYPSYEHNRTAGRLVVLSGKTGIPMGVSYLTIPNSKETYMSPVIYTPNKYTSSYILFGSGGETIPGDLMGISIGGFCYLYIICIVGDLMGISMEDFCYLIFGKPSDKCPTTGRKFEGFKFDENGIFVLHKGEKKGVMVPPIVADVDGDGTMDILMTSFEGSMKLFNGQGLTEVWTATFPGCETYGLPAPGYFNDDKYLDFLIHWNFGEWMFYEHSNATVVSGKDGDVLWTMRSNFMQMSASLSIATDIEHQDLFLFKVQARDSIYGFKDGKVIKPGKNMTRPKRHEEEVDESEYKEVTPEEEMKILYDEYVNCDDDLSSLRTEVFILDRTMLDNPLRLLNIHTNKHNYDTSTIKHLGDDDYPNPHGYSPEEEDPLTQQLDEGGVNIDNMTLTPSDTTKSDSTKSGNDGASEKVKRAEKEAESKTKNLCTVESLSSMAIGAVGNLDGDEYLDYVFINSLSSPVLDSALKRRFALSELVVQKVNLELGTLDGVFKHVPVTAETSMVPSKPAGFPGEKKKTFLPLQKQPWLQYMGTKGSGMYDRN